MQFVSFKKTFITAISCCFASLVSLSVFGQSSWSPAFVIKKSFHLGESKSYEVNELFKIDNLLAGIRSNLQSIVSFQVIDTADNGFWLSYTVKVHSAKEHEDSAVYLIASLIDGLRLFIYAKNGQLHLDSAFYFSTKKRVSAALDSIANQRTFGKNTTQFTRYLQTELKEDAGLGSLLAPLMLFEVYYSSEVYKKFRLSADGISENILNRPLFTGIIEREWMHTSKDSTVKLNYLFTGNPVPAAGYYKSFYEALFAANNLKAGKYFYPAEMRYVADYTFRTQPGNSFPSYLYKKNVSEYLLRSVSKIEMKEIISSK